MKKKEIIELEYAKGIGIFLVLVGHSMPVMDIFPDVYNFIYLFHMPLFFFLSGFLSYGLSEITTWNSYLKKIPKKIKAFLMPYIFVSFSYVLIKIIFSSFVERPVVLGELFDSVFITPSHNPALFLWFIYTLAIITIIAPFVFNIKWYIVCPLVFIFNIYGIHETIFGFNYIGEFLIFYWVGYQFSLRKDAFLNFMNNKNLAVISLISLLMAFFIFNGGHEFSKYEYRVFQMFGAFLGISTVLLLCFSFSNYLPKKALNKLGNHSFEIYLLHFYFVFAIFNLLKNHVDPLLLIVLTLVSGGIGSLLVINFVLPKSRLLSSIFGSRDIRRSTS